MYLHDDFVGNGYAGKVEVNQIIRLQGLQATICLNAIIFKPETQQMLRQMLTDGQSTYSKNSAPP